MQIDCSNRFSAAKLPDGARTKAIREVTALTRPTCICHVAKCQSDYFISAINIAAACAESRVELSLFRMNACNEAALWQRWLRVRCAIRRRDYQRCMQTCHICRIIIATFPRKVGAMKIHMQRCVGDNRKIMKSRQQTAIKTHSSQAKLS